MSDRSWKEGKTLEEAGKAHGQHLAHCFQGEYKDCCKYGYADCPAQGHPWEPLPTETGKALDHELAEKVRRCMAAINQSASLGSVTIAECPSLFAFGHIYDLVTAELAALKAQPSPWQDSFGNPVDVLFSVNAALARAGSPHRIDCLNGQAVTVPVPECLSSVQATPEPPSPSTVEESILEAAAQLKANLAKGHSPQFAYGYDSGIKDLSERLLTAVRAEPHPSPEPPASKVECKYPTICEKQQSCMFDHDPDSEERPPSQPSSSTALPPDVLASALQDRIAPASGRLIAASPIKPSPEPASAAPRESGKAFARSDHPQLRASESDPRGDHRAVIDELSVFTPAQFEYLAMQTAKANPELLQVDAMNLEQLQRRVLARMQGNRLEAFAFVSHLIDLAKSEALTRARVRVWDCRVCGFGVTEGAALVWIREHGEHYNTRSERVSNNGIAYCPVCSDETLRSHK